MDAEISMYLAAIEESLETIAACVAGLDDAALRWTPAAGANGLAVIAKHALANAHRNVLAHFAGEPYEYHREREFVLEGESDLNLNDAFDALRLRMHDVLKKMPHSALDARCDHARLGPVPGRAVLLQAARHAAEHAGEARLTRQLLLAR